MSIRIDRRTTVVIGVVALLTLPSFTALSYAQVASAVLPNAPVPNLIASDAEQAQQPTTSGASVAELLR